MMVDCRPRARAFENTAVSWPRDDAKLERVRALMADEDLDALVVRAPDNVLYLTNFWGMKGYDAVVFPREGEPVLIASRPPSDDAERTAWTRTSASSRGYDERDPRPPPLRALDLARQVARAVRPRRPRALARHAGLRPHGRRADDLPRRPGSTPSPTPRTRRRCSPARARSRPRRRSSGSGSRTSSPPRRWSTSQAQLRPGMTEAEAAALWQGYVHGAGTGCATARSSSPSRSRSSGRGRGSARSPPPATGRSPGARADALRDLGLHRRLLGRPHEEPLPGRARPALRRPSTSSCGGLRRRRRLLQAGRQPCRARPAASASTRRRRLSRPALAPDLPRRRRPRARAALCAPGAAGTIEEGMVLAIEPGIYWPEGGGLRLEDNFLITADGAEQLSPLPGRLPLIDRDKVWTGPHNRPLEPQSPVGLYDTTLRDGEQTVGVVLDPARSSRSPARSTRSASTGSRPASRASRADDAEAIRLIMAAGLDAEIWGFSRAVQADVEALVELGVSATVIESPVSDGKLAAFGVSRDDDVERIAAAVVVRRRAPGSRSRSSASTARGPTSASSSASTGRRRGGRAGGRRRGHDRRRDAGDRRATRRRGASLARRDVPVHFHGHDDFGLATASAVAAVRAGASWIHGTMNGMGERAGNANLLEVALALEALYGVATASAWSRRARSPSSSAICSGYALEPWTPLIGENLFVRESRRRREPVPRSAGDRAVLGRARRRRPRRSCSARRAGSTRSGSRPRSSGSTSPRSPPRAARGREGPR